MGNDLAIKNNNPGNLRVPGTNEFQKFATLQEGYDALIKQIKMYQDGSSNNTTGKETLDELIKIYAPKSDKNNPEVYAKRLAEKLNIPVTTPISQIDTNKLAVAITSVESPQTYNLLKTDKTLNTGVSKGSNGDFILGNSGQNEMTPSVKVTEGAGKGYYKTIITTPEGKTIPILSKYPLEEKVVYGDKLYSEVGTDWSYSVTKDKDGKLKSNLIDDKAIAQKKINEYAAKAKTKEGLTNNEMIYATKAFQVRKMELLTEKQKASSKEGYFEEDRMTGVRNAKGIQAELDNTEEKYYTNIAIPELKRRHALAKAERDYAIKQARESFASGKITKQQMDAYQKNYDNLLEKDIELDTNIKLWSKPITADYYDVNNKETTADKAYYTRNKKGGYKHNFGTPIDEALNSLKAYVPDAPKVPTAGTSGAGATKVAGGTAGATSAAGATGATGATGTAGAVGATGAQFTDPDPSGMVAEAAKTNPELAAYFDEESLIKQNKLDQETIDFIKSQKEFNAELPAEEYDYNNLLGNIADVGRGIIGVVGAMQDVPEYQRGEMFKESMDDARRMKDMGLSEQEKGFLKQNAERAYGFATANLRGLSGGSAAAALGGSGEAQRILQSQYGEMAALDQGVRRQNRAAFAQAAVQDEAINRKIFEDKMNQVMANKAEGAALARDAYTNMNERAQFNQQYGKGSQYQQYMNEQILSLRQARENLKQSAAFQKQQSISELERNQAERNALIKKHQEQQK